MIALILALSLQEVDSLIRRLGDDSPEARREAYADLAAKGAAVEADLRKHVDDEDPEIRLRVRELIDAIEAEPLAESLIAQGLREKWVRANLGIVAALSRGEFERVLESTRGAVEKWRWTLPSAPLRGYDAGVLINHIVARIDRQPLDPERFQRLAPVLDGASFAIGTGNGASGDWLPNLDILRIESLMTSARERAYRLSSSPLDGYASPQLHARILREHATWSRAVRFEECLRAGKSPELLPELLEWDRQGVKRWLVAELMGLWRTDPKLSIPCLRRMFDDPDGGESRVDALHSLVQLRDPGAAERVRALLTTDNSWHRENALLAAATIWLEGVDAEVLKSLHSTDDDERMAACFAAGRLGIEEARDQLVWIFGNDDDIDCAHAAMDALALLGTDDLSVEEILNFKPEAHRRGSRLNLQSPEDAAILMDLRPSFEGFLRHVDSDGWDYIHDWYVFTSTPEERDMLDRKLLSREHPNLKGIMWAYAFGDPERLNRLMPSLLESDDAELVRTALHYAEDTGFRMPNETIARLLDSPDGYVATSAIEYALDHAMDVPTSTIVAQFEACPTRMTLNELGRRKHAPAGVDLVRLVEKDPSLSLEAARALGGIGIESCRADVDRWLESDDPERVAVAIEAIGVSGDPDLTPCIEALTGDPRPEVRGAAVVALTRMRPDVEILRRSAKDSDPDVRKRVAEALSIVEDAEAFLLLLDADSFEPHWRVSSIAREWLWSGRLTRTQVEPYLRRSLRLSSDLTYTATQIYLDEGVPVDADVLLDHDDPFCIALRLDSGDEGALSEGVAKLHELYQAEFDGWGVATPLVSMNALLDSTSYQRVKSVRVRRDDPSPVATVVREAGLACERADFPSIRWPEDRDELSGREVLVRLTDDPRHQVVPLLREGTLELLPWPDAIRFWRDEHLRRARARRHH